MVFDNRGINYFRDQVEKMTVESKAMDHIRKVLEQFGNKYFASNGALKRETVKSFV